MVRAASPPLRSVVCHPSTSRRDFLQRLGAKVRYDLVFDQLPIALRRSSGNVAGRLPLVDAGAHERRHGFPTGIDERAGHGGCDDLGGLRLCLCLGALKRDVFGNAFAGRRIAVALKFQPPRIRAPAA